MKIKPYIYSRRWAIIAASLIITLAFGNVSYAVVLIKDKTNPKEPVILEPFAANEFIVKFKDYEVIGVVVDNLFDLQQEFSTIVDDDNLDVLNRDLKVKGIKKLIKRTDIDYDLKNGKISKGEANQIYKQSVEKSKGYIKNIMKNYDKGNRYGKVKKNPYLGNIYKYRIEPGVNVEEASKKYAKDPRVEFAHPNYKVKAHAPFGGGGPPPFDDPYYYTNDSWGQGYSDLWGLQHIGIRSALDMGYDGEGVVVAVVDSGLDYNHMDIAQNVWTNTAEIPNNGIDDDNNFYTDDTNGWDFTLCERFSTVDGSCLVPKSEDNDPMDGWGHGTLVAGIIGAVGNNNMGIIGVAPSVTIMPLKGLADDGLGYIEDLYYAMLYAISNGADVINNSWGCSVACPSVGILEDIVQYAHEMGVVEVFSAGNSAADIKDFCPQNMTETITVGAFSTHNEKLSFSNSGYGLDFLAPGAGLPTDTAVSYPSWNILSLLSQNASPDITGSGVLIVGQDYLRSAGTSMAAPFVSGLAAILIQAHPEYTIEQIRQQISKGSKDIGPVGYDKDFGFGKIKVFDSLQVTNPLEVLITSPDQFGMVISGDLLNIRGLAQGTDFQSWQLDYGFESSPGVLEWSMITTSSVSSPLDPGGDDFLAQWDVSQLYDGDYILKLSAINLNGDVFENYCPVTIDDPNSMQLMVNAPNATVIRTPNKPSYVMNETVTVEVIHETGYLFTGWSGDAGGSTNPVNIVMNTDKTINANFAELQQHPVLAVIGDKTVNEGQNLQFTVSADDFYGHPLTLSAVVDNGEFIGTIGANFTDNRDGTGTFEWMPFYDQQGIQQVTFQATDGTNVASETVNITVNDAPIPSQPVAHLTIAPDHTVTRSEVLNDTGTTLNWHVERDGRRLTDRQCNNDEYSYKYESFFPGSPGTYTIHLTQYLTTPTEGYYQISNQVRYVLH